MKIRQMITVLALSVLFFSCDEDDAVNDAGLLLEIEAYYDQNISVNGVVMDYDTLVVDIDEIRLLDGGEKLEYIEGNDYAFSGMLGIISNGERELVLSVQRKGLVFDEIRVYQGEGSYMILDGQRYDLPSDTEKGYLESYVESDILIDNGWRNGMLTYAVYANPDTSDTAPKYLLRGMVDIPLMF